MKSVRHAVIKKITKPETIVKLPSIIKDVFSSVKTNITFDDCLKYFSYIKVNQTFQIKSMMVPGKPEMIDDLSYWIINL